MKFYLFSNNKLKSFKYQIDIMEGINLVDLENRLKKIMFPTIPTFYGTIPVQIF